MTLKAPYGEIILYEIPEGHIQLDVRLEQETIWLNLNQLAVLFDRDKSVISRHLNKVFKEGELKRKSTVAKYATVQAEGNRKVQRNVEYFNLDAIISVGYRVNSKRGTQRRISNAALVAITLLIAESRPDEKDILARIVTHLLCEGVSP